MYYSIVGKCRDCGWSVGSKLVAEQQWQAPFLNLSFLICLMGMKSIIYHWVTVSIKWADAIEINVETAQGSADVVYDCLTLFPPSG